MWVVDVGRGCGSWVGTVDVGRGCGSWVWGVDMGHGCGCLCYIQSSGVD